MQLAPFEVQADKAAVLAAVESSGGALAHAAGRLRGEKVLVLCAVQAL